MARSIYLRYNAILKVYSLGFKSSARLQKNRQKHTYSIDEWYFKNCFHFMLSIMSMIYQLLFYAECIAFLSVGKLKWTVRYIKSFPNIIVYCQEIQNYFINSNNYVIDATVSVYRFTSKWHPLEFYWLKTVQNIKKLIFWIICYNYRAY